MAGETVQSFRIRVTLESVVLGPDGTRSVVVREYDKSFGDGTDANSIGYVWNDESRSLATTTETLDLDALVDFKGATMTDNNTVKVLWLEDLGSTSGQTLKMGGGDFASGTGPLVDSSDKLVCQAGGLVLMVAPINGYPITASTGDGLTIESSAAMNYRLTLAGDNT
jgi:hypothetical protein